MQFPSVVHQQLVQQQSDCGAISALCSSVLESQGDNSPSISTAEHYQCGNDACSVIAGNEGKRGTH